MGHLCPTARLQGPGRSESGTRRARLGARHPQQGTGWGSSRMSGHPGGATSQCPLSMLTRRSEALTDTYVSVAFRHPLTSLESKVDPPAPNNVAEHRLRGLFASVSSPQALAPPSLVAAAPGSAPVRRRPPRSSGGHTLGSAGPRELHFHSTLGPGSKNKETGARRERSVREVGLMW